MAEVENQPELGERPEDIGLPFEVRVTRRLTRIEAALLTLATAVSYGGMLTDFYATRLCDVEDAVYGAPTLVAESEQQASSLRAV